MKKLRDRLRRVLRLRERFGIKCWRKGQINFKISEQGKKVDRIVVEVRVQSEGFRVRGRQSSVFEGALVGFCDLRMEDGQNISGLGVEIFMGVLDGVDKYLLVYWIINFLGVGNVC